MTAAAFARRFPAATLPPALAAEAARDPDARFPVLETVRPAPGGGYRRTVVLDAGTEGPAVLEEGWAATSPYLHFRWLKAPGEIYGRSPVMKALPDIRTANKVVELVLKNATIAVTGIWQADDDGVLNPAAVVLKPGTIIPKAVGSAGLTPLKPPGQFDVSQLVLEDLRARIRHALLADQLAQVDAPRMTATEVLERAEAMTRLLGATYGRLQAELLTPLIHRCLSILRRRGEIPDLAADGRTVEIQFRSPLAQAQAQRDARSTLLWVEALAALGPEATAVADMAEAARWLGRRFGVPPKLVREAPPVGGDILPSIQP